MCVSNCDELQSALCSAGKNVLWCSSSWIHVAFTLVQSKADVRQIIFILPFTLPTCVRWFVSLSAVAAWMLLLFSSLGVDLLDFPLRSTKGRSCCSDCGFVACDCGKCLVRAECVQAPFPKELGNTVQTMGQTSEKVLWASFSRETQ